MSLCAIIPVAGLLAANTILEGDEETPGFGPRNFSVAAFGPTGATHAALHAWDDPAFAAAVKAIPSVVWEESDGDPVARTKALIESQSAQWGAAAPQLPDAGLVTANTIYQRDEGLWLCIQPHDRSTFGGDPSQYPALIRRMRRPGEVLAWRQPTDAFDAYRLVNPFTGEPDRCLLNGVEYVVTQGDGAGLNVWQPDAFGWVPASEYTGPVDPQEPEPEAPPEWVQPTGAHDSYSIGDLVTFQGAVYRSLIASNVWSPAALPSGWELVA